MRHNVSKIRLILTGMGMGAADIVPGVSGGTIAFIAGIYEGLIDAIRTASGPALRSLLKGRVAEAFRTVPWQFLLPIAVGIVSAVFLLSTLLSYALETNPDLVWSFFFGLVAASAYIVRKRVRKRTGTTLSLLLCGAAVAYIFVGLAPRETAEGMFAFFASGAVAASAMILPGISGSFILVILGKYEQVLAAVVERDIQTLAVFAAGVLVGLAVLSHILSRLFRRYHDNMIALLAGLMIGSLRRIWPWKDAADESVNIMPALLEGSTIAGILFAAAGASLILLLDRRHALEDRHPAPERHS